MYNPQSYILTSKISLHLPISFMVRLSSFYLLLGFCIFFWPTYYLSYISHYHSNLKDFHPSTFLMKSSHHITFHIPHSVCPNLNFIMQIIHAFVFVYPELCMLGFPSHTSTVDQAILPASVMYTLHKFSSISRVCIASLIFLSQDFFFSFRFSMTILIDVYSQIVKLIHDFQFLCKNVSATLLSAAKCIPCILSPLAFASETPYPCIALSSILSIFHSSHPSCIIFSSGFILLFFQVLYERHL